MPEPPITPIFVVIPALLPADYHRLQRNHAAARLARDKRSGPGEVGQSGQADAKKVRYGYTAREHDALTGLIYYRARSYDTLTGQVLQRDPIGFASGDLNLYAYIENDPYN